MEKMTICFVGLGSIAYKHLQNLRVYSKSKKINFEFYALRSGFSDFEYPTESYNIQNIQEDQLRDYLFDIVFITNPTHLHYSTLKLLANYANSFFIEKPIFDKIDYDIKSINIHNKLIYVSAPLRHSKIIKEAKNYVDLNKVLSCRAICSSYLPDWQKDREYSKSFRINSSTGGGIDLDLIHEIDYIIELFGWPIRTFKIAQHFSDLHGDSNDFASYLIQYPSIAVELHLDHFCKFVRREFECITSEEVVVFDLLNNRIDYKKAKLSFTLEEDNYYLSEIDYFFDLINNKVVNINDTSRATKTLEIAKVCK
jgi:predicted dehydrogenase